MQCMWIQTQMMHEKTIWSRLYEPKKKKSINRVGIENKSENFSIGQTSIKHQPRKEESFEHKNSQFWLVEGNLWLAEVVKNFKT